jgi:hypothetical protein
LGQILDKSYVLISFMGSPWNVGCSACYPRVDSAVGSSAAGWCLIIACWHFSVLIVSDEHGIM